LRIFLTARLANAATFLFSAPYPVFAFSFCLDAKRNKKIKANAMLTPLCRAIPSISVTAHLFTFRLLA